MKLPHLNSLTLSCILMSGFVTGSSQAATQSVEVQPNDTLGGIIINAYPGLNPAARPAVMQAILDKNPTAFIDNNINRLIVGRTLELPEITELPVAPAAPAAPEPANVAAETTSPAAITPSAEQNNNDLQIEIDRLTNALSRSETENQALQARLAEREAQADMATREQATASGQTDQLQQELSATRQQLTELRTENARLGQQLETLQNTAKQRQPEQPVERNAEPDSVRVQLEQALAAARQQLSDSEQQREALDKQLQAQNETQASLSTELETFRQQNEELQSALQTAKEQAEQTENELLAANDQTILLQGDLDDTRQQLSTLQKSLDDSELQRTTLQADIEQIRVAAARDVALAKKTANPPLPGWWPWLLALLLPPLAWLLGRRSRTEVQVTSVLAETYATEPQPPVATDPVAPAFTTSSAHPPSEQRLRPDNQDAAIKLDMARAYLDLRDAAAANEVLREVINEGGSRQQQEAREILSFIN